MMAPRLLFSTVLLYSQNSANVIFSPPGTLNRQFTPLPAASWSTNHLRPSCHLLAHSPPINCHFTNSALVHIFIPLSGTSAIFTPRRGGGAAFWEASLLLNRTTHSITCPVVTQTHATPSCGVPTPRLVVTDANRRETSSHVARYILGEVSVVNKLYLNILSALLQLAIGIVNLFAHTARSSIHFSTDFIFSRVPAIRKAKDVASIAISQQRLH